MSGTIEDLPMILSHLDEDHSDVAQIFATDVAGPLVGQSHIIDLDLTGLTIRTQNSGELRITLPKPADDVNGLFTSMYELLAAARSRLGRAEPSSLEAQEEESKRVPFWRTTVRRARVITPSTIEVVLGGRDLDRYVPGKPDSFLYVMTPPLGRTSLDFPIGFAINDLGKLSDEDTPVAATYTVRRWRPEAGEIDLVIVMHGDDSAHSGSGASVGSGALSSTMSGWAKSVQPGCPVVLWGPRSTFNPPAGTDRLVIVVDDTGLPAAAAIVEATDPAVAIDVIAEVANGAEIVDFGPSASVRWLFRNDTPVGTTDQLLPALHELLELKAPTPSTYFWGGAESRVVTTVRKLLRHEHDCAAEAVSMTGYWRQTSSPPGSHAADS